MKKKLLLLPLLALSLSGCSFEDLMFWKTNDEYKGQKENEDENVKPTEDPIDPAGPVSPTTPVQEIDDDRFEGFSIRDTEIIVTVEGYSGYPTAEVIYKDGYSYLDITSHWTIGDETIATVDDVTGKVKGVSKGITRLFFSIEGCDYKCSIPVYVINSQSDIVKTWKKMGSTDHIEEKDTIIIACPEKGKAATDDAAGHKLHSTSVTFSSDNETITDPGLAAKFYVYSDYKGRDGYTFEIPEREDGAFLACTNTSNVSFFDTNKSSQTVWSVNYDSSNGVWDMRPGGTVVDGWMMYNSDIDQFATYQSNPTQYMFVVSLYKLVYSINM